MMLEAVWLKNKKEVFKISPVMNLLCDEDVKVTEIEVCDGNDWYSCEENQFEADDFVIRIKKD